MSDRDRARVFLDTNVILYLLSADEHKADRAEAVIADGGIISVQVLNEITAVGRYKLKLSWAELDDILGAVCRLCPVEALTVALHERGRQLARRPWPVGARRNDRGGGAGGRLRPAVLGRHAARPGHRRYPDRAESIRGLNGRAVFST